MFRLLLILLCLSLPIESFAQFLPFPSSSESGTDWDELTDAAKRDGVSIVVITPDGSESSQSSDSQDMMEAELFLRSRARIREIFSSAPTLRTGLTHLLHQSNPDYFASGSKDYYWLLWAILTAFAGLALAMLIARPVGSWLNKKASLFVSDATPVTTADKSQYLLLRALFCVVHSAIMFLAALSVAVIFDPIWEPSRRIIFEIVLAYSSYIFFRYVISWNLTAHDLPNHRLINATDTEAKSLHRDFYFCAIFVLLFDPFIRFFSITGAEQLEAGFPGGLSADHIELLKILGAFIFVFAFSIFILKNWRILSKIFSPRDSSISFYRLRVFLASLIPLAAFLYSIGSFGIFVIRLALAQPDPGSIIVQPFLIFYPALIIYGLVLIFIQYLYNRRHEKFRILSEQAGSSSGTAVHFEYKPMFRTFFERCALTIITLVGIGELSKAWSSNYSTEPSSWGLFLDILLAMTLCFLVYQALSNFINRRIEEEGGVPIESEDEESMGEGGGAGESRMATLLPIMRYVMIVLVASIAIITALANLGFDIGPIFAGAGVVGIAVGFGAQTLIRDIFSGAFFLIDDAFRKGEYIEIDNIKGSVEKISIRSFQLRHHLGALHTIPFGEIHQLTNYSRDWVMMKLPLRVTYDTDVEKVRKLVKKLGQKLLEDPVVGDTFMQPLKSQGVYKMEDSAMIIRVKFMTKPGEQFVTRKVVYQSIQDLFAREGIKFAHKEVTVRVAHDDDHELTPQEKKAATAAAREIIDSEAEQMESKKDEGDR